MTATPLASEVLGRGWSFPPRWDGSGAVELVEGEEDVRQAILILLRTGLRERVMHPDYGVGIDRYVFAGQTAETRFRLQEDVRRALVRFEPRVLVDKVEATESTGDEARIDVVIEYRIDPHRRPTSLVFPFYLQQEVPA
ncbi:MAG: GPW/gp25 family protein [Gaiellaceae bacterium]